MERHHWIRVSLISKTYLNFARRGKLRKNSIVVWAESTRYVWSTKRMPTDKESAPLITKINVSVSSDSRKIFTCSERFHPVPSRKSNVKKLVGTKRILRWILTDGCPIENCIASGFIMVIVVLRPILFLESLFCKVEVNTEPSLTPIFDARFMPTSLSIETSYCC